MSILEPLLCSHPNWDRLQLCVTFVSDDDSKPASYSDRLSNIAEAITRRNNKSTLDHSDVLMSNVKKEIRTGLQFPFLPADICKTKGIVVALCDIVVQ